MVSCTVEMATPQRTRPRAVDGAQRLPARQLKSALRISVIAGELFLYVQQWFVMKQR